MPPDVTPLANAFQRLREGLARHLAEPNDEQLRDGLLRAEWSEWRHFRDIRTRTTHTYDAETASSVVEELPAFIDEVEFLCTELMRRSS